MKIYSMSMCPDCDYVYDESEYAYCPKCANYWKSLGICYLQAKRKA